MVINYSVRVLIRDLGLTEMQVCIMVYKMAIYQCQAKLKHKSTRCKD